MGHSSVTCAVRIALAIGRGLSSAWLSPVPSRLVDGHPHGQHGGQSGPCINGGRLNGCPGRNSGIVANKGRRNFSQQFVPNVQSGYFTRPYPYHLDYYKMRYGGSYAPYFGNLYGPPQVVTAPPYYGPYYGGCGGYGYGSPDGSNGYNGFNGAPVEHPGYPPGTVVEGPVENVVPNSQPAAQPNGENLPAPSQ